MFTLIPRLLSCALLLVASAASAVTVQDSNGTFTLEHAPQRVVVLELSFVDALAAVDVSPVGVADDNDPQRILPAVRQRLAPWKSVGTRAQPSLEVIAALKPDLIIADSARHGGILGQLKSIAPTLMLKSRNETWEENLQSAAIIGKVLGKDAEMLQRLALHHQRMKDFASQLPKGLKLVFGTSREQQFNLHSRDSYTGSVLAALGMNVPESAGQSPIASINLEQLLAINPDWLLVAHYRQQSIVRDWQQDPLWQMLTAAQKNQVAEVDSNGWARMRGLFAAEQIARDLVAILHHQPVAVQP
ncbi:Fe(3+) dicitrate ABC transporter substrate-binding protein FecB [Pantoea coffeiphila]|uniref:Fe(3+) dicitrate ABC transporter substrate-binding protein FecB n=1 Tax=Pantoea coffeiphila TaxID=1465635 RepID=UPI00196203BD|nr:Fe(3+) dicitrate ABC transporter substrate-binding protein FecB [Pantoea coffeiphila]MBM7343466.1 iron complex transport system substrate-binding protein [Pantoea coffeiphila]